MAISRLSSLSTLRGLTAPKLQSVLQNLIPNTALASVQTDNGFVLTAPVFLDYNETTGVVTFSVDGATTQVSDSDIQIIQP